MSKKIHGILGKHSDDVWCTESMENETFLNELFVPLENFEKIFQKKRMLVKSRKGTWKSTLKIYFKHRSIKNWTVPIELKFNSIFDGAFFDRIVIHENFKERYRRFSELIKYSMLVEMGKEITSISHSPSSKLFIELSKKNLPKQLSDDSEIWIDWEIGLNSGSILSPFLDAQISVRNWAKKNHDDSQIVVEYWNLIEPLTKEIQSLCRGKKIIFLIDDTDKDWFSYREIYANFISSFMAVINDMNEEFAYWDNGPKTIIFIRSDLFEAIRKTPQGNIWKMVEDKTMEIDWKKDDNYFEIINKRLRYIQKIEKEDGIPASMLELTKFYFPAETKKEGASYFLKNVLLDWSYLRPRDLIILCKKIIESDWSFPILRTSYATWLSYEVITDEFFWYLENQEQALELLARLPDHFDFNVFKTIFEGFEIKLQNWWKTIDDLLKYFLFQSYVWTLEYMNFPGQMSQFTTPHFAYREGWDIPDYNDKTTFIFHSGFRMALKVYLK